MLLGVDGIGDATADYFLILLGHPGVKPDRMIHRFLRRVLGRSVTNAEAARLLECVAKQLRADLVRLDHAIWSLESLQAADR
jgi:hypothetical protein